MSIVITCKSIIGIVFLSGTICFDINGVTGVEENNSNDTLACDDVADKVALYTPSLFLEITQVELLICC